MVNFSFKNTLLHVSVFEETISEIHLLKWSHCRNVNSPRGQRYSRWVCWTLDWSRTPVEHCTSIPRVLSSEQSAERITIKLNNYYDYNLIISVLLIVNAAKFINYSNIFHASSQVNSNNLFLNLKNLLCNYNLTLKFKNIWLLCILPSYMYISRDYI